LRKLLAAAVLLIPLLASATALSQVTNVTLAMADADGKHVLRVTNHRNVSVEALFITGYLLGPKQPLQRIFYDSHFINRRDVPIAAGGTQDIPFGYMAGTDATLRAVVFSDGTTEGDEESVGRILNRRRVTLDALRDVQSVLQSAMDRKLSAGDARTQILDAREVELKAIADPSLWEERGQSKEFYDWAALCVESNSKPRPDGRAVDPQAVLRWVMKKLQDWRADLEAAKPPLPQVDGLSPGSANP
jgi:hypothetical protein